MTAKKIRQNEKKNLPEELIHAKQLIEEGYIKEASQIVLELEKRDDYSSQDLLYSKLLKAMIFDRSSEYLKAVKYVNQVLEESQKQSDSFSYLDGLLIQAHSLVMIGDLTRANTILKQAKKVLENLKRVSKTDLRERESFMVRIDTLSIALTGGPRLGLNGNQKALELAKDSDDKGLIVPCLLNLAEDYQALGDYDKAIYYAKRAIEVNYPPYLLILLGLLIEIFLVKGDVLNAKFYFQEMSELREKDQNKYKNLIYQYYEALILKTSLRARDRIKAEELFKQMVKKRLPFAPSFNIKAIINLCSLLLTELSITNDTDIINEINPYIRMLLNFAEQPGTFFTYYFAAETYLLQGKLHLLTFNIKKAKRFLIQAQQVANRFGPSKLATKIFKENEDLLKNEHLWKKLKEEDAPMADRVVLARLHEQIEGMIRNPTILTFYVRDEKVAITKETKICLVCRGEVLRFSYICQCGTIYCEHCARAITNLENVCWVCNRPIDYLKPIKEYEKPKEKAKRKKNKKKNS
ncbi:MAG: hypothetical protein ACFFA8_05955 [Promethearchaeota archaeon]